MDEPWLEDAVASKANIWMPLVVGDYLRKTMRLTTEQHGAYLLLLMACWAEGGAIPADEEGLAATVRLPLDRWQRMAPTILSFFEITGGVLTNPRLTEELGRAQAVTLARSEAGQRGAAARWGDGKNGKPIARPLANASQNDGHSHPQSQEGSGEPSISGDDKPDRRKATRLSTDWRPSDEDRRYAIQLGAKPEEIARDVEDFRDYWHSKSGSGAAHLDWPATWRRWCRTAADRRGSPRMATQPRQSSRQRQVDTTFADINARRRREAGDREPLPEGGGLDRRGDRG